MGTTRIWRLGIEIYPLTTHGAYFRICSRSGHFLPAQATLQARCWRLHLNPQRRLKWTHGRKQAKVDRDRISSNVSYCRMYRMLYEEEQTNPFRPRSQAPGRNLGPAIRERSRRLRWMWPIHSGGAPPRSQKEGAWNQQAPEPL